MRVRPILIILFSLIVISCGEDRREEYNYRIEPNEWIEAQMRDYYLWYDQIKPSDQLNYFAAPEYFFSSLLNAADGKSGSSFSTIQSTLEPTTRSVGVDSYGFEFETLSSSNSTSILNARVLYVVDNSPASEAGLKRGDWITKINSAPITSRNRHLLLSGESARLAMGVYDEETKTVIDSGTEIIIPASRIVTEKPVYLYNTYTVDNKEVGYIIYNHFTSGVSYNDESYLTELATISNTFKQKGVSELVLDFRFNPGGTLPAAQLLSCMIVPEENLTQQNIMAQIRFNDNHTNENDTIRFSHQSLKGGSNLNLQRIYFLVSSNTASAAEVVINSVKPYMKTLIIIGSTTVGKDVGTIEIRDAENRYPWILNPVVCKIYNKDGSAYYPGIPPTADFNITDRETPYLKELGDPEETLLKAALGSIEGIFPPPKENNNTPQNPQARAFDSDAVYTSISEKKVPGVVMK